MNDYAYEIRIDLDTTDPKIAESRSDDIDTAIREAIRKLATPNIEIVQAEVYSF